MADKFNFDVFLSHNGKDKPAVQHIARLLRDEYNQKAWLDKWNLVPGKAWQYDSDRNRTVSETGWQINPKKAPHPPPHHEFVPCHPPIRGNRLILARFIALLPTPETLDRWEKR